MTSGTLFISNGHAEDLIGAALAREVRALEAGPLLALPLVAEGKAYAGMAEVVGPLLTLPSGGFPFGSLENLRADVRAGLLTTSVRQWFAARKLAGRVRRVVVVGDTYALAVGALAAREIGRAAPGTRGPRLPLVHVQPLVSSLYAQGMSAADHLRVLARYAPELRLDAVLADPSAAESIKDVEDTAAGFGARVYWESLRDASPKPVHNPFKLAAAYQKIMNVDA